MYSGKLMRTFEVKVIINCINQGKNNKTDKNTARIFGMKVKVNS
jgi:hypothetical protein